MKGVFTGTAPSGKSLGDHFGVDLERSKFLSSVHVKSFGPYHVIGYRAIFHGSVASYSFSEHGVGIKEMMSGFIGNGFLETEPIALGGITYNPGLYIAVSPDKRNLYIAQVMCA